MTRADIQDMFRPLRYMDYAAERRRGARAEDLALMFPQAAKFEIEYRLSISYVAYEMARDKGARVETLADAFPEAARWERLYRENLGARQADATWHQSPEAPDPHDYRFPRNAQP